MHTRGLAAVAALLLLGVAAGYAAASAFEGSPATDNAAQPVVASDPSIPVDPALPPRHEPNDPPMATDLPLVSESLGTRRSLITFPVPETWTRSQPYPNEVKFKPKGGSNFTYVLRIEQVTSQQQAIPDILKAWVERLKANEDVEFGDEIRYTYDTYECTYSFEGYRRHQLVTWLDLTGSGVAEVEIALTGRERDVEGMHWLMQEIVNEIDARSG